MRKVNVYIDGFNLYFGLMEAGLGHFRWYNPKELSKNLLKNDQSLNALKYFTSMVVSKPDKMKRQQSYIDAIRTTDAEIHFGHYQSDIIECRQCHSKWKSFNEKKTDVNIATQMLKDAFEDKYDMAVLISGDTDLVPPIEAIKEVFPQKRILVAFPPKRVNEQLKIVSDAYIHIGKKLLSRSQFPDNIVKEGVVLSKPMEWYR